MQKKKIGPVAVYHINQKPIISNERRFVAVNVGVLRAEQRPKPGDGHMIETTVLISARSARLRYSEVCLQFTKKGIFIEFSH